MRHKKIIFVILLLLLSATPVLAQEINYPNLPRVQAPQDFLQTAAQEEIMALWIKYIVHLIIWASGLLAFLGLVAGGVMFLISSGNPEKIVGAKKQIFGSFLGLIIILSSYTILSVLSPLFLSFSLPEIERLEEAPDYPEAPTKTDLRTTVDVFIPVGEIIEGIFETYLPYVPPREEFDNPWDYLTRLQRIENNLWATEQLLPDIVERSQRIRNLSRRCRCWWKTKPDPRCTSCASCFSYLCTGDPCKDVRGDIVSTQEDLLPFLFGEIEGIEQKDAYGEIYEIETNLVKEIEKHQEEIQLLKEIFGQLGRAEKFIKDCNWGVLNNSNQYSERKREIEAQGGVAESVAFFDEFDSILDVPFEPENPLERWYPEPGTEMTKVFDESTLYCALGGTDVDQPTYFEIGGVGPDPTEEEMASAFSEEKACGITVPFGEVLDKSHRMTRLLINKLELIVDRKKMMLESIGELQLLVSRCSSRLCFPFCFCFWGTCFEIGCFGPACPKSQISRQMRRINQAAQEIKDATDGIPPYDTKETMGIRVLFDDLVFDLLDGMEKSIRNTMKDCGIKVAGAFDDVFFSCDQAIGGTDVLGSMIRKCCIGTRDWKDTEYGFCLNKCYLKKILKAEEEEEKEDVVFFESAYLDCLEECLLEQAVKLQEYKIFYCDHELRFQCCNLK